jgi:hypothetical protein
MSKRSTSIAAAMLLHGGLLLCLALPAQAQNGQDVLELTNKLGVTTKLTYCQVTLGQSGTEKICVDLNKNGFILKLQDDAYIIVPLVAFKEATLSDGSHKVTLSNGATLSGKLVGQIKQDNKVYDLPAITKIRRIEAARDRERAPVKKSWKLSSVKPKVAEFVVAEPRFSFTYQDRYKSGGMFYTWETGTFVHTTEVFIIDIGGEEVTANLSDFPNASLRPALQTGTQANITIKSQSGVETTGSLVLRNNEKKAIEWALVARLPELADTTMVLIAPSVSLKCTDATAPGGDGQPAPVGPSK